MPRYTRPIHVHAKLAHKIGPPPWPATHENISAYLDRCAAACLEIAETLTDQAETALADGRPHTTAALLRQGADVMAEYRHIVSMRTPKS